jgi:Alpha/beta hydrolase domain
LARERESGGWLVGLYVGLIAGMGVSTATLAAVSLPGVVGPLPDAVHHGTMVWNVDKLDYVAEEYLVSGAADVYEPVDMADAPDMRTRDVPKDMARRQDYSRPVLKTSQPYTTRIIVYRPRDRARFSGNVVLETAHPLHGGLAIVWSQLSGYFAQHGDAYVGIQHPATFGSIRASDPVRYAKLSAVDPTQLWGMIAQIAALVRNGGPASPLHELPVRYVFLTGFSLTGVAATTFADFHHESARAAAGRPLFDGYLSMANSMYARPIDAPVIRLMTQSDFNSFGGLNNRGEDSDSPGGRYRLWEVAGASHINSSPVIEPGAAPWASDKIVPEPPNLPQFSLNECTKSFPTGSGPNTLPLNFVMAAAFGHLYAWVRRGELPPHAPRIETLPDGRPKTDASGNALGGIRLPDISVPAATFGTGSGPCFLFGYRAPYTAARMRALYTTHEQYTRAVETDTRGLVQKGWLRPQDAGVILTAAKENAPF